MPVFTRRKRSVVGLLASLVATAIFLLLPVGEASAVTQEATQNNACVNNIKPLESALIPITMQANPPGTVEAGNSFTLAEIKQELNVPGAVFLSGYGLELYGAGEQEVPANVQTTIAATNTTVETQKTNVAATVAKFTITDPDGIPGNGSPGEESTNGLVKASYNNQTWTAAAAGAVNFREATVIEPLAPNPPGFTTTVAGVTIEAIVGSIKAKFGCDPGTVVEQAEPKTIERQETAATFASTTAVTPKPKFALTLTTSGTGSGTFQCNTGSGPEACASEYPEGTEVEVIAKPDSISEFVEFSGDCLGTSCKLTMNAAHTVNALFEPKEAVASVPLEVYGEVEQTTAIENLTCFSVNLGPFVPGVAKEYENNCLVKVTSTGKASALSAADESAEHTGHLVQGTYFLAQPLEAAALDAGGQGGVPVGYGALTSPHTLLNWGAPITKDLVGVGFKQPIGETEGLHTGKYAKTITLTLEQTTP